MSLQNGGQPTLTSVAESLPNGIDFGYCGISQTATRTVTLSNPYGQGAVKFDI